MQNNEKPIILKGITKVEGYAEGEALVTSSFLSHLVNAVNSDGVIRIFGHPLVGQSYAGKIVVYDTDKYQEGLVHTTYNIMNVPGGFLCSCCSCSCAMIRALKEFKAPYMIAKSNYMAQIDQDACIACGICRDERCPMDAIVEEDGEFRVLKNRCIGCGVCIITCPSKAITLIERPVQERDPIASDITEWGKMRMKNRMLDEQKTQSVPK